MELQQRQGRKVDYKGVIARPRRGPFGRDVQKTALERRPLSEDISLPDGQLAIDSGSAGSEGLESTGLGRKLLDRIMGGEITFHCSWINIAEEVTYILCRKVGHPDAKRRIEALIASGFLVIEEDPTLHERAAEIKCERAMPLPGC